MAYFPRVISALVLALATPCLALAAGSAVFQNEGEAIDIVWNDDGMLRITMPEDEGYMLARDGKAFMVAMEDGVPMVLELDGVLGMAAAVMGHEEGLLGSGFDSLQPTGQSETHGGITGQVYRLHPSEAQGADGDLSIVLTSHPLVTELTQVYLAVLRVIIGNEKLATFESRLPAREQGVLRAGDDLVLAHIAPGVPDDSLFELPAPPVNMADMFRDFAEQLKKMQD